MNYLPKVLSRRQVPQQFIINPIPIHQHCHQHTLKRFQNTTPIPPRNSANHAGLILCPVTPVKIKSIINIQIPAFSHAPPEPALTSIITVTYVNSTLGEFTARSPYVNVTHQNTADHHHVHPRHHHSRPNNADGIAITHLKSPAHKRCPDKQRWTYSLTGTLRTMVMFCIYGQSSHG